MTDLLKPLDIILRGIREERLFREDFLKTADTISDKIYSYYNNPNCSCKSTIVDWVNKNVEKTNEMITRNDASLIAMTNSAQQADQVVKATPPPRPPNPANPAQALQNPNAKFGKIYNIERTEKAYSELILNAINNRWMYRGVTVVPNTVEGLDVWSVFFY